ncbi:MAG: YgaP family membrane protein [Thermodesulfobacteriota bacterium]
MTVNDWVHVFAGAFILISLALGTWLHPYWYLFTAFVGANLLQYGFTKFCPRPPSSKSSACRRTAPPLAAAAVDSASRPSNMSPP